MDGGGRKARKRNELLAEQRQALRVVSPVKSKAHEENQYDDLEPSIQSTVDRGRRKSVGKDSSEYLPSPPDLPEYRGSHSEDQNEVEVYVANMWKENTQAIAKHDFKGTSTNLKDNRELHFKAGDLITIIKVTKDKNWLKGRSLDGREGLVPVNHLQKREEVKLHSNSWFHGNISREQAEKLLHTPPLTDGRFLLRDSIKFPGDLTLSLYSLGRIDHYRVLKNEDGTVYIDEEYQFDNIYEIIEFYKKGAHGLAYKLTVPVEKEGNHEIGVNLKDFKRTGWAIERDEVFLDEVIGEGEFGEVRKGRFKGQPVAIKLIKDKRASEKILTEASIMTSLKHKNLLRLIGVVTDDPVMMVLEYCDNGSLLEVLRTRGRQVINRKCLLEFARGVLEAMVYLESKGMQHRDLACRNVLVDDNNVCKVSDFGLAKKYDFTLESGKFPVKWTAPEAINEGKFTNKSDVWSYGIFLWELFSYGRVPYPSLPKGEVLKNVMNGYRMGPPPECPSPLYDLMTRCWNIDPNLRPTFKRIKDEIFSDTSVVAACEEAYDSIPS